MNFDIIKYLDSKNIKYYTEGKNVSAGWIGIKCVFCSDKSNHLGINLNKKTFSCFKCGQSGTVHKLVMRIDNCTFAKAKFIIEGMKDPHYSYLDVPEKVRSSKTELPASVSKDFESIFIEYLQSRRFQAEYLIHRYDLYCGGVLGELKWRLVIPVYYRHRMMTYVARDVTGIAHIPYVNCAEEKCEAPAKELLYNLDSATDKVLIVEGIFDAWRIGDGCVATFGTKYTKEQIALLRGKKTCFVMFDSDATDQAHKLAFDLSSVVDKVEVIELDEGDPDDLTEQEVQELRRDIGL